MQDMCNKQAIMIYKGIECGLGCRCEWSNKNTTAIDARPCVHHSMTGRSKVRF